MRLLCKLEISMPRCPRLAPLVKILALAFFAAAVPSFGQEPRSEGLLAPLTKEEMARAGDLARRDPRVGELVGLDARVGAAQFVVAQKPELRNPDDRPAFTRHAAVYLGSRDYRRGAWVLVDLRVGAVAEVRPVPASDVPFNQEDLADAWNLARQNRDLSALMGQRLASFRVKGAGTDAVALENEVLGLPIRGTLPEDPCTTHRCLALIFRQGNTFLEGVEVVVDLTAGSANLTRRGEAPR